MKKYTKFGVIAIAAILALTVGLTAVAFAQSPDEADSNGGPGQIFIGKVAGILGLDEGQVADAFAQARSEMKAERLQNLIDQGVITQEEADQLKEWWEARPDVTLPGPFGDGMKLGRGCQGGPPPAPEASE